MLKELQVAEEKAMRAARALPADTQQVCIDLPGEVVQCVVHKPTLEIMLRKHRDVIFDIQLFKGMQYTVEADQSDFYNARDKRIVEHKRKQRITFTDGQRMHLWVGRNFKGQLVLKANDKVIGRYEPSQLDPTWYDDDLATKPAPLMFVMKNQPDASSKAASPTVFSSAKGGASKPDGLMGIENWSVKPALNAHGLTSLQLHNRQQPATPVPEQHPTIAILDGTVEGMPAKLFNFLHKVEESPVWRMSIPTKWQPVIGCWANSLVQARTRRTTGSGFVIASIVRPTARSSSSAPRWHMCEGGFVFTSRGTT